MNTRSVGMEYLQQVLGLEAYVKPERYRGTSMPMDGWFQPCKCCRAWTTRTVKLGGAMYPMCRRCKAQMSKHTEPVLYNNSQKNDARSSALDQQQLPLPTDTHPGVPSMRGNPSHPGQLSASLTARAMMHTQQYKQPPLPGDRQPSLAAGGPPVQQQPHKHKLLHSSSSGLAHLPPAGDASVLPPNQAQHRRQPALQLHASLQPHHQPQHQRPYPTLPQDIPRTLSPGLLPPFPAHPAPVPAAPHPAPCLPSFPQQLPPHAHAPHHAPLFDLAMPLNLDDLTTAAALDEFLQWGSDDIAAALAPITAADIAATLAPITASNIAATLAPITAGQGSAAHLQYLSPGQSQDCSPEKVPMHHAHGRAHPQPSLHHAPSLRGPAKHPHLPPAPAAAPQAASVLANQLGKLRVGGSSSATSCSSSLSSPKTLGFRAQGKMLLPNLQPDHGLAHIPPHPKSLLPPPDPTLGLSAGYGQAPSAKLKLAAGGSSSSRKTPALSNNSSSSSSCSSGSSSSGSGSGGAPSIRAPHPDCGRQQQWADASAKHDDYSSSSSADSSISPGDLEAVPSGYQPSLAGTSGRLQVQADEAAAGYPWRPCGLPFPLKAGSAAMLHR